ncbi:MAG: hypothetical protein QM791_09170 [Ferruginibacter sp.]
MQLKVKPHTTNVFPGDGLFLKGADPVRWLQQLEQLGVSPGQFPVYALPVAESTHVWGCFIALPKTEWKNRELGACEPCQCVHNLLYIPQMSMLSPIPGSSELVRLLSGARHILHPECGLVALDTVVDWRNLLLLPAPESVQFITPAPGAFIPAAIQRAEVQTLPPDDLLKSMEESRFPSKKQFTEEPLSTAEKIKLSVLKALFSKKKTAGGGGKGEVKFPKLLEKLTGMFPSFINKWIDNLEEDMEKLERRNQTEMQKLLDMFKNNPDEALKYAIPLDNGTGRGGMTGNLQLERNWAGFDLFGSSYSGGRGGSAPLPMDAYAALLRQYRETAQKLINEGKHDKAAFVYMKLLKDHNSAAQTLENGKLYPEAAAVYLKMLQNKSKAAACYEKGQMITSAIGLYKEMKEYEKTGDLYRQLHKEKEAMTYFQAVADEHVEAGRYVKAAVLMRNKMYDPGPAQELLLHGWRKEMDAFNCINNYFQNIEEPGLLLKAIEDVYQKDTTLHNKPVFLTALRHEVDKNEQVTGRVQEIAYEIVSGLAVNDPAIVSELKYFNKDKSLLKDVLRYKEQRRSAGKR